MDKQGKVSVNELTDIEIYRRFVRMKGKGEEYEILSTPEGYPYDVTQELGGTHHTAVELKSRNFAYDKYPDTFFDKSKIDSVLAMASGLGYINAFIFAIYPESDRVVLFDLKAVDWDKVREGTHPYVRIGWEFANKCTVTSTEKKTLKEVVYFPLKHTDKITYVYRYPGLKEEYRTLFAENMKKVSSGDGS